MARKRRFGRLAFAYRNALRYVPTDALDRGEWQVLRCLADHESTQRGCWPSWEVIAAQERLARRSVAGALRSLSNRGLVLAERCCAAVRDELRSAGVDRCHGKQGGSHFHLAYAALASMLPTNVPRSVVNDLLNAQQRQPLRVQSELARGAIDARRHVC